MNGNIVAQSSRPVKTALEDQPILVILPVGMYWLDMTSDGPMEEIPFQGEPVYAGQGWGGAPELLYGLEARG